MAAVGIRVLASIRVNFKFLVLLIEYQQMRLVDGKSAMKRAFTIVELLVAMGLLAAILAGSGMVFAVAVNAQRTANATAEIAQKLRGITDQLNVDFTGLQKDCPMAIWFELDAGIRHDQILFFANSNFSSYGVPTINGFTARVYYGQANIFKFPNRPAVGADENYQNKNILARRQHVYTASAPDNFPMIDPCNPASFAIDPYRNDLFEFDNINLSDWKAVTNDPCSNHQIITTCFNNTTGRAVIDFEEEQTLHMLMSKGVGNFTIQWAYFLGNELRWFPSKDPDRNGDESDSDFTEMLMDEFGVYFTMPGDVSVNDWDRPDAAKSQAGGSFSAVFFPKAFKFTFTLYDSNGVFKDGKTFTHIVYLEN